MQRKVITATLLFLLSLALLIGYIKDIYFFSLHFEKLDYRQFYTSAYLYWQGKSIYLKSLFSKSAVSSNLNGPFFTFLLLPLGLLNPIAGFYFYIAGSILCGIAGSYLLAAILTQKSYFSGFKKSFLFWGITLVLFSYYPTFANMQYGQTGLIVFFALSAVWYFSQKNQDISAGIALGIILSIKIFAGLIAVYFLFKKRWVLLAMAVSTFLVCNLCALALFGLTAYHDYYRILHYIYWYSSTWNASIFGMAARLFGYYELNTSVWNLPWLTPLIHKLSSFFLLIGLWFVAKKEVANSDLGFCYALVAMLLISPLGWLYYFPVLLIVFSVIVSYYQTGFYPPYIFSMAYIALFLSNIPYALIAPTHIKTLSSIYIAGGIYFYALLLLASTLLALSILSGSSDKISRTLYVISDKFLLSLLLLAFIVSYLGITIKYF